MNTLRTINFSCLQMSAEFATLPPDFVTHFCSKQFGSVLLLIREHPFNWKGGLWFLSLKWAEKNILLAICALKNVVFVEKKIMKKFLLRCEAEKNILTPEKNHSSSPPALS